MNNILKNTRLSTVHVFLFLGHGENHQIPLAQGAAEDSVRLLLTKNLTHSLSCPGCQMRGLTNCKCVLETGDVNTLYDKA